MGFSGCVAWDLAMRGPTTAQGALSRGSLLLISKFSEDVVLIGGSLNPKTLKTLNPETLNSKLSAFPPKRHSWVLERLRRSRIGEFPRGGRSEFLQA